MRDLGLAVDHDAPAGQAEQVDAVALAAEAHLEAVVRQPFGTQARIGAGLGQQVHGDLLQHAGADAAQHVVGAALLDDDVVDAVLVQQRAEQQPRGAGADDGDLGLLHASVSLQGSAVSPPCHRVTPAPRWLQNSGGGSALAGGGAGVLPVIRSACVTQPPPMAL